MTIKQSFKRSVRARMTKTGERYTAARRQVLAKADTPTEPAPLTESVGAVPLAALSEGAANDALHTNGESQDLLSIAATTMIAPASDVAKPPVSPGMSDDAIRRGSGRGWEEWFVLLDAWGATGRTHTEIATWVNEVHGVDGWWAQGVTVGYERARGMRVVGQLVDGFAVSASKTVEAPIERLYEAFADPTLRARWLPDAQFTITTAMPHKSIRALWDDHETAAPTASGAMRGSRVEANLTTKGPSKSQVGLQHVRLRDAATAEHFKRFWRERLAVLQELLEK